MGYIVLNPANNSKDQNQASQENKKPFYYLNIPDFFSLFLFLFYYLVCFFGHMILINDGNMCFWLETYEPDSMNEYILNELQYHSHRIIICPWIGEIRILEESENQKDRDSGSLDCFHDK